ncbi:MAG: HD domain-containing protein [Bacteroidota bacterium]
MIRLPFESILRRIGTTADALGVRAHAVGGAVRDALLGRETVDLDVVAVDPEGEGQVGIRLAKAVAEAFGAASPAIYATFGTAAVTLRVPGDDSARLGTEAEGPNDQQPTTDHRLVIEFVGARKESYRRESRKPLVEDGTLDDDLARRDFTVNALAVSLGADTYGEVEDPHGGLVDLRDGLLRTPLDPHATFEDDPLRMLRAARFAAQLGFRIAPETLEAMRESAHRIEIVSQERITDEIGKTLASPLPSLGFSVLHETGLLDLVLPELSALAGVEAVGGHKHKDNLYHTLEVVDNLALAQAEADRTGVRAEGYDLWLRWAALFHDIAKPETKRFAPGTGWTFHGHEDRGARKNIPALFRRLKLPLGDPLTYVRDMVRLHHRPTALVDEEVTDSAVRRLLFEAGDHVEDLMLLVRADVTSKNEKRKRRYLRGFDQVEIKMREVEEKDRMRNWEPPVSGDEIKDRLDLPEGIAVGILKEWVREAVLDGEVPNEHDPAFDWVAEQREEAVYRAGLFHRMVRELRGPEKRAMGAIKEAVFWDDLPLSDEAAAVTYLHEVKDEALAEA